MYNHPKLTPLEHSRLRRMEVELQEITSRLEQTFKEELNPLYIDTEILFLNAALTRAQGALSVALETHKEFRTYVRPHPLFRFQYNAKHDYLIWDDLIKGTDIQYAIDWDAVCKRYP